MAKLAEKLQEELDNMERQRPANPGGLLARRLDIWRQGGRFACQATKRRKVAAAAQAGV